MKTFVISDLHLGHKNIIKLANRPFKTVEDMDDAIINNWNKVVSDNDIVYVLGDFCFKGNNMEYYLDKLNGKIILIKGNHDKYIQHSKILKVKDYLELQHKNKYGKIEKYIMCHYPINSWNGMWRDSIHLYGHVHKNSKNFETLNHINSYNLNCEFWDYTPQLLENFISYSFFNNIAN